MDKEYYNKKNYNKKVGNAPNIGRPRITTSILDRHVTKGIPHMSLDEINTIEDMLDYNTTMFEFGMGGSTLHFSKFVNKYICIDNDTFWWKLINNQLKENGISNVSSICVDMPNISHGRPFINIMDSLEIDCYDVILIDCVHQWRPRCLRKSLKYINDDSIILFHDYYKLHNMKWYKDTLKYVKPRRLVEGSSCAIITKEDII